MAKWEYKDGRTIEFESYAERQERHKRIALALYETCKSENLSIGEFKRVIQIALDMVDVHHLP